MISLNQKLTEVLTEVLFEEKKYDLRVNNVLGFFYHLSLQYVTFKSEPNKDLNTMS